jgi:hypothetical protein
LGAPRLAVREQVALPVDWGITSARKKGFFSLLADVTGSPRV